MKKYVLTLIVGFVGYFAAAQNQLNIHTGSGTQSFTLADDDSIYFDAGHTNMYLNHSGTVTSFPVSDVINMDFTTVNDHNVYIVYNGNTATVSNPLAGNGVEVTVSGAHVTVNSIIADKDVNFICSGTSANGEFKIYSEYRFNLILDDLSLTNPSGAAINNQSKKKMTIHMLSGGTNSTSDGLNYVTATGEDQKGSVFSEGKVDLIGGGQWTVTGIGADQHAIASDEDFEMLEGTLTIASAVKDGLHASEGFYMNGGNLTVHSSGDGIDAESENIELNCGSINIVSTSADVKALKCDSIFVMNGGNLTVSVAGDQSKGIKCGSRMYFNGGQITANTSGAAVLSASGSGTEPSYSSLLSGDSAMFFNGTEITLTTTGQGSRGISCDGNVTITDGSITITSSGNGATYTNSTGVTDSYHGACVRVNGDLTVSGGTTNLSNSGKGGKGIDVDGAMVVGDGTSNPVLNITTTGTSITVTSGGGGGPGGGTSGTYDEAKAMKADGNVTLNSGAWHITSADDGVKSGGTVTINAGELLITNSKEAIEAPFITVNGGNVSLVATDDGFNATHGTVSGGTESNDGSLLKITGGYVVVSTTGGDGIDSNGSIQISGGTVIVHGPQSSPELGMDYNGTSTVSGGFVVISGPGQQMLQGFNTTSTQRSFILKTSSTIAANTLFHVMDASGNKLFTFKPVRGYQTMVFSSPNITNGTQYKIYTTGSDSGTEANGLYTGGTYTPGTLKSTFTATNTVTTVTF
ncbi:carbohydrate-binding domain-containing protein [Fluviicola sp.]|uniref:carbohydrate-binding domain-containing protein n=1 Tax=Fluviicola sp. TaxID=1917219 RepID=UPI0031D43D8B